MNLPIGFSAPFAIFDRPHINCPHPSSLPFDDEGRLSLNNPDRHGRWISVMITNECPVACAHCFAHSGGLLRGQMSEETLERTVREIASVAACEGIHITGGEPFGARRLLLRGCQLARELGLKATVLTSANWGKHPERLDVTWEPFAPHIDTLFITLDVYHQQRVPLAAVRVALEAARRSGVQAVILNPLTAQELAAAPRPTAEALALADEFAVPIHAWPLMALGRAADIPDDVPVVDADQPCGLLAKPIVLAGGEVHACACGSTAFLKRNPLRRKSIHDAPLRDTMRGLGESLYVQGIRALGPVRLLRLIGEEPGDWAGQCGACGQLGEVEDAEAKVAAALLERAELVEFITEHRRRVGDLHPEEHLPAGWQAAPSSAPSSAPVAHAIVA